MFIIPPISQGGNGRLTDLNADVKCCLGEIYREGVQGVGRYERRVGVKSRGGIGVGRKLVRVGGSCK